MEQVFEEIKINTEGQGFYNFTENTLDWIDKQKIKNGILNINILHTSASLIIQENADPDVKVDLERFFKRLCPDGDSIYDHTLEGPDDMPAHVRAALTSVHLSIPFADGRLLLGTWQGIYLWEHRTHPHNRQIVGHLVGD